VESGLVNGQNYYTAITRASHTVKLWTEDAKRLAEKLAARSGEKTSSLEGLGRLRLDSHKVRGARHQDRHDRSREANAREREARKTEREQRGRPEQADRGPRGLGEILAGRAQEVASFIDRFLRGTLERDRAAPAEKERAPQEAERGGDRDAARQGPAQPQPQVQPQPQPGHHHDRGGGFDH
jgi:hypothetical protein